MPRKITILLSLAGLAIVAMLVFSIGPDQIAVQFRKLGWGILLVLAPYSFVLLLDASAWRFAFSPGHVPFFPWLWAVHTTGTAIDNVTPLGYMGGEPYKIYALHKRGLSGVEATAAVVRGKTCQAMAIVPFIAAGCILLLLTVDGVPALIRFLTLLFLFMVTGAIVSFFLLQRRGFFRIVTGSLARLGIAPRFFERHADTIERIDTQMWDFYSRQPGRTLASVGVFFTGWMAGALEAYLILWLLGHPGAWREAIILESLGTLIRVAAFFVPAGLGVIEGGPVAIVKFLGMEASLGLTIGLSRRIRELFYMIVGFLLVPVTGTGSRQAFRGETEDDERRDSPPEPREAL